MTKKTGREGPDNRSAEKKERTRWVRSRTRRHMRKLITAGAAAGAALQFGCGPYTKDPSPEPFVCPSPERPHAIYSEISGSAHWGHDGVNWLLTVGMRVHAYGDPLIFTADPVLTDATMLHLTRSETEIEYTCQPTDDASTVYFTVPVDCAGNPHTLTYRMKVTGERSVRFRVPVEAVLD